jgi:hypothetical protein
LKTNKKNIEESFSGKVKLFICRISLNVHKKLYFIGKVLSIIVVLLKIKNKLKVPSFLKNYSQG